MSIHDEDSNRRSSGILLHPTSLPGPHGIGELGKSAFVWIDKLAQAKQMWWQILPLTPPGYGNSPYSSFSAFAGNTNLISRELLVLDGLISNKEHSPPKSGPDHIDFVAVGEYKKKLLNMAWKNYQSETFSQLRQEQSMFESAHKSWLDDYALFRAIKDDQGGRSWFEWPRQLVLRRSDTLKQIRKELDKEISVYKFGEFLFHRQWSAVKACANKKGIRIIGDVPIFVAADSADVWAHQELFQLDENCNPKVVAGVPPDYFSATGQLWGNPLYDWKALKKRNFDWWIDRIRSTLEQVDTVRLDHFRGFESYWEVPAKEKTAENGKWVKAPGNELFKTLRKELGGLPLIAEDLGLITEEVHQLRQQFDMPGMRVLHFAFGGDTDNPYLPHNYEHNSVVYTGTHDNNTTRGWYANAPDHETDHLRRYLGRDCADISWDLIRTAWSSVADYAIAPLQDILDLDEEARMNLPGKPDGNWAWRYRDEMLTDDVLGRLADLTELYGR